MRTFALLDTVGCGECSVSALVVACRYASPAGLPELHVDRMVTVCPECGQVGLRVLPLPGMFAGEASEQLLPGSEGFPMNVAEHFVEEAQRVLDAHEKGDPFDQ